MTVDGFLSENDLIERLLSALREAPDTTAHVVSSGEATPHGRADLIIEAQIAGQPVSLIVEAKRSAFPRDVREATWQLRNYIAHSPSRRGQTIPMVVSEAISPGAKSFLRDEHIGYFDTGGSLYIPASGAFLFIDKPLPKRAKRAVSSLFSGQRGQVLHAIWVHRNNWFGVHEIAHTALVSPTTTSETLIALERHGWIVARGSGPAKERKLVDLQGFLDAWTNHQTSTRPKSLRHYYIPGLKFDEIMHRIDQICAELDTKYAITGTAAAQAYAPYLSSISQLRCRLAANLAAEAVLESMNARLVREGWNLGIIETKAPGELAFRERIDDAWFADPLQTYLDLVQEGGRAKELAEHLRDERLRT